MSAPQSLWYGFYRGAVYPVDLHAAPADLSLRARVMKSLVELCAEKIVQDSNMTLAALSVIPKPLYEPLMKEALYKNREMAIRCIVDSWPTPVLLLRHMVPQLFTSIQPLYNMAYLNDIVKQGLRYTTSLVHTFLVALKNNSPTKLKFLDLTGYPTAEVIVYFLATHCMLAHNEVRHQTIRNMYEQAIQQVDSDSISDIIRDPEPMEPMEHVLPQDCSVTIKLDAIVTSESTHNELCKALKVSSFPSRKLRMVVGRLSMTCLGHARIIILLKQLQPQHLTGLQLQYNALTAEDMVSMAPALMTLVNLESLDLSRNSIFFYQHDVACTAASQIFSAMPLLQRLDLSNNRIKTRLRRLLESIALPLTYLRLSGCSLAVTDMIYLSHSQHCSQLAELDLSENNLRHSGRQVREVLSACRATLCVLEMEDCYLDIANLHTLMPAFTQLTSLMYLNVAGNHLPQASQVSLLASVAELVSLQVFKSSYALECYDSEGEEDRLKATALAELNVVANRSSVQALRPKPLMLFLTELELS